MGNVRVLYLRYLRVRCVFPIDSIGRIGRNAWSSLLTLSPRPFPPPPPPVYPFRKFPFLWHFLGLPEDGSTLRDVRGGVQRICKMSWSELQTKYKGISKKERDYLPYFCGLGSYIVALLHNGYGFDLDREVCATCRLGCVCC